MWSDVSSFPPDGRLVLFETTYKGGRVKTVAHWAADRAPAAPIAAYALDRSRPQFTTFCVPTEGDRWAELPAD